MQTQADIFELLFHSCFDFFVSIFDDFIQFTCDERVLARLTRKSITSVYMIKLKNELILEFVYKD